jgi:hypothetical protein
VGSYDVYKKEPCTPDINTLRYAFDSPLNETTINVTTVCDDKYIYKSEGVIDTVVYKSYVADDVGGKGTIYSMEDE